MKPSSIGKPEIYLEANKLSGIRLPNQVKVWVMSPSKYIQEASKNAKQCHYKENLPLSIYTSKCLPPFSTKYCPECCDMTPELEPKKALSFQSIIDILQ
jgi:hypothetical protein